MIIDMILDRKDSMEFMSKEGLTPFGYIAKDFYNDCMEYSGCFNGIDDGITKAMDEGTEEDVKAAISDYILSNGYSEEIIDFVNSVDWLTNDCIKVYTCEKNKDGIGCARIYDLNKEIYYLEPMSIDEWESVFNNCFAYDN